MDFKHVETANCLTSQVTYPATEAISLFDDISSSCDAHLGQVAEDVGYDVH